MKSDGIQDLVISGGTCLVPGHGLVPAELRCGQGVIAELAPSVGKTGADVLDAANCHVLPGIIDIHGDAFERQIMPRPRTMFPLAMAFADTDRQLVANGITTAFHGVTISWEPGLRSLAEAQRIIAALDALEPQLRADNRLHIRWETFAVDQMPSVIAAFGRNKKPLLAFNDHTTGSAQGTRTALKMHGSAERAMLDAAAYDALLDQAWERRSEVPAAIAKVSEAARSQGIVMLSHDDRLPEMRRGYRALGAQIAEFPLNRDTLHEAGSGNDHIVLGAPNIVRGGSHNGAISAETAIRQGLCDILASDYYYPAPLHAALALADSGALPFADAWACVSATPATACGLADRGRIEPGLRADLVILDRASRRIMATIVAGRVAYRGG